MGKIIKDKYPELDEEDQEILLAGASDGHGIGEHPIESRLVLNRRPPVLPTRLPLPSRWRPRSPLPSPAPGRAPLLPPLSDRQSRLRYPRIASPPHDKPEYRL